MSDSIKPAGFVVQHVDDLFDAYWRRVGSENSDAMDIAKAAFDAAFYQSRNYVADAEVHPEIVQFANGRMVKVGMVEGQPVLYISQKEPNHDHHEVRR